MLTRDKGVQALKNSGKKITAQRGAIIDLLVDYGRDRYHPSAEEIFRELKKKNISSLSMATVYSTTQLLAEKLAVRILTIDDKKIYIDPETASHGHFMCTVCKNIWNVPIGCKCDGTMDATEMMACRQKLNMPTHSMCQCIGHWRSIPGIAEVTRAEILLYGVCTSCAEHAKNGGRKG